MKNALIFGLFFCIVLNSCRLFSIVNSETQIEASKSFVLGQGNHGRYGADVKNTSRQKVEVLKSTSDGSMESLGILGPGDSQHYEVPRNTAVVFKNLGNSMASIKVKLVGDTNLSMGYQNNQK